MSTRWEISAVVTGDRRARVQFLDGDTLLLGANPTPRQALMMADELRRAAYSVMTSKEIFEYAESIGNQAGDSL